MKTIYCISILENFCDVKTSVKGVNLGHLEILALWYEIKPTYRIFVKFGNDVLG